MRPETHLGGHENHQATQKKVRRLLASPCDRPPSAPTGVHLHFTAVEARTHLRFRGKIRWNDVTTDTSGLPINTVDRWDIQWRATDADGVPVESEDLKTIHRTKRRDPVHRAVISDATVVGSRNEVQTVSLTNFGGADEVQSVSLSSFGDGDSFRLKWQGNKSTRISKGQNYKPSGIKEAIENIPGFDGQVEITSISPSGFDVTFGGRYRLQNVAELEVVDTHNCTGSVSTSTQGAGPRDRFKLEFNGQRSVFLVHGENYTREGVKHAIQNIPGFVGTVDVAGAGTFSDDGFTVTFTGTYGVTNVGKLKVVETSGCTGTVSTDTEGNAGTGVFRFTTRGPHGFFPGDHVRISSVTPVAYNGTYTVVSVGDTTFTVTGVTGVGDLTEKGFVTDVDDSLHIPIPDVPRPKTWYWQARVRARSGAGCWSRWSIWTTPVLPWTGADPRPPAPMFTDPGAITFDRIDKARHEVLRLKFTFNEVQDWDVPGGDTEPDVAGYWVDLDRSDDGVTWGRPYRHKYVRAKDVDSTDDDDTSATRACLFYEIRRRFWYRCRVRTVDRFSRRGDPSEWTTPALPFDNDRPPNPENVSLRAAHDRIHVKWQTPTIAVDTRGTVSGTSGLTTLTGTGTKFTVEVEAGATIRVGAEQRTVRKVTSDTSLVVMSAWGTTHTAQALKLIDDDPDVAQFRVQIAKSSDVDTSQTPDEWSDIYDSDKLRGEHKAFRIPDTDEDEFFYARVQAIDAALNHSRWVYGTLNGNDDPDVSGEAVQLIRDRVVLTAHKADDLVTGALRGQAFRIDRHYRIRRITASVGFHDPDTHPLDGTPDGTPVKVQWFRSSSDDTDVQHIIELGSELRIPANHHRDAATVNDLHVTELFGDDMVMAKIIQVGATREGADLSTSLVLIPIAETGVASPPEPSTGGFSDAFSSAFDI